MKDTKTISQLGTRAGCADMQAYTREGAAPIQEAGQKINWEKLKLPAGGKTYCVERVDHPRGGVIYRGCKRLLDLTGALVSLPLLCFPMVLIAALVKLDSPGPALYRQERLGLGGKRLMVKPGLTGLAQVSGSGCLPPEEKIVYDMEYIRRQSVALDLLCIWKTIQVVLHPHSARSCQS